MRATLGNLTALIAANERLLSILNRPTKDGLKRQLQATANSEEKLETLKTLLEKTQRSLLALKDSPVTFSVEDSTEHGPRASNPDRDL